MKTMNSRPTRIRVSNEELKKIKKEYSASEVYVYSPSFLLEYMEKIVANFPEEKKDIIMKRLEKVKYFVLSDNVSCGMLCSDPDKICMRMKCADISDSSFSLKKGYEYLETIFVHELLHNASRRIASNGASKNGVQETKFDDEGHVIKKECVALNEGITQFLAERISGRKVDDKLDGYAFNKKVVYLLSDILGEDVIRNGYFFDVSILRTAIRKLSGDDSFYKFFNKRLDSICSLSGTIEKIKAKKIKVADAGSLERLEQTCKFQKEELVEKLFAKIILPKAKELPLENRHSYLIGLIQSHSELLEVVKKYIPEINDDKGIIINLFTDERIAAIQKEIAVQGMDFSKLSQALSRADKKGETEYGKAVARSAAIERYYSSKGEKFESHVGKLTPLLRHELTEHVKTLQKLEMVSNNEKTQKSVEAYRQFLRKYFKQIPNIDEEIEKIAQELRETKDDSKEMEDEKELELEEAIQEGIKHASESYDTLYEGKKIPEEKDEESEKDSDYSLSSDFVYSTATGEIYDQRNLSIYERAINIARATGEMIDLEDETISARRSYCADKYIESLSERKVKKLQRLYGEDWERVIRSAYEEGFRKGTRKKFDKATKTGQKARAEDEKMLASGKMPLDQSKVDLEKLRFCYEKFTIVKKDSGYEVVDRDGNVVRSEQTRNMVMFANKWVEAAGKEVAFSETGEKFYSLIQNQSQQDLVKNGIIDFDTLRGYAADLEESGPTFSKITDYLFQEDSRTKIMDTYFRMQTPNAAVYPPVDRGLEEETKTSSK